MPIYDHRCDNGHEFERHLRFDELVYDQICECGRPAIRLIRAPMVFVQGDIRYDSPIDGKPITNKHARIEDLKRSGCIEYDPEMKKDHKRRIDEGERALDKSVDSLVDREIAAMPARKRENLMSELSRGVSTELVRNPGGMSGS